MITFQRPNLLKTTEQIIGFCYYSERAIKKARSKSDHINGFHCSLIKAIITWRTGHTSASFISGLPSGLARPSVPHIVYGRTIRNKFPDFPINPMFHAEVGWWPAVELLVEVVFGVANWKEKKNYTSSRKIWVDLWMAEVYASIQVLWFRYQLSP